MSVPQTPQAATLISTSPSPTSGTGTSSTRTTPFSRNTPARMVLGMGPSARAGSNVVLARLIGLQPPDAWPVLRTCHRRQRSPRIDPGSQRGLWPRLDFENQTSKEMEFEQAVSKLT